ncbi:MAG: serine/threonine-protein kinase [Planctomycetota bacterium]|nr:serine/threonine-protein kinase [Planctomycetota bacterium]
MIDGYQLTRLIGEGGMGAVFQARKNGLDYALKLMIHPSPRAAERFDREAQSLAKVSKHSHIVTIHSYSKSPPWPYLVSELIEGDNLSHWLHGPEHHLELERSLKICIEIASALDHIHHHGIWHRDLKPENILIRQSDQKTFLTDFGIAKDKESQDSLTQSGELIGTLNYMPPEQLSGDKGKTGPQSDIWSLGVVLYQLATGQLPFQAPSSAELMSTILFQEPTPPSSINSKLPKGFSTLISSALQKDPVRRYASANDFAKDCQALLSGHAVVGAGTKFSSRIGGRLPPRQRVILQATIALGLILILALSLNSLLSHREDPVSKAQIVQDYETLSRINQFNESTIRSLTVQSIENLVFPDKNKDTQMLKAELERWVQLEIAIQKHARNDIFKDDQVTQYKRLRKRLNPLYFLQNMGTTKQDPDGLLPQRWQRILLLARQLKSKPKFARKQLKNLGNADFPESGFALFLLGLTQIKDKQWEGAEQSFLTLQTKQIASLKRASIEYLQSIYQSLLVELVLTKAHERKDIQRVIRQIQRMAKSEELYRKQMKVVQGRLDKAFQNMKSPESFIAGEKSYILLEQICGQIPLVRPTASAAFHRQLAENAHKRKQTGRALFHHYQRLKSNKQAKLPKEYRRYVFQDTSQLNRQVFREGKEAKLKLVGEQLLEISRADVFFAEILDSQDVHYLENNYKYFSKLCEEKPYDPYPRYWRFIAKTTHLYRDDSKKARRAFSIIEADKDFVIQSSNASPVFKAMTLLTYCEYYLRFYERSDKAPMPQALEQKLFAALKDSQSFQIPELDKLYHMKCRLFQL